MDKDVSSDKALHTYDKIKENSCRQSFDLSSKNELLALKSQNEKLLSTYTQLKEEYEHLKISSTDMNPLDDDEANQKINQLYEKLQEKENENKQLKQRQNQRILENRRIFFFYKRLKQKLNRRQQEIKRLKEETQYLREGIHNRFKITDDSPKKMYKKYSEIWFQNNLNSEEKERVKHYEMLKEEEYDVLWKKYEKLRSLCNNFSIEMDEAKEQAAYLSQKCSSLLQEEKGFKAQLSRNQENIQKVTDLNFCLENQLSSCKSKLVEKEGFLIERHQNLQKLEAENLRLKENLSKEKKNQNLLQSLEKQVAEKHNEIINLKKQFETYIESLQENAEKQVQKWRSSCLKKQEEKTTLQQENAGLNFQVERVQKEIEQKESEITFEKKEKDYIQQKFREQLKEIQQKNSQCILWFQQQSQKKDQRIQHCHAKYQEEILNLEKSLKKTQKREETMQMEIENLKKDYERRFSQFEEEKNREIEGIKKVARTKHHKQIDDMKKEKDEWKKKFKELLKESEKSSFIWNKIYGDVQTLISSVKKEPCESYDQGQISEDDTLQRSSSIFSFPEDLFGSDLKESLQQIDRKLQKFEENKSKVSKQKIEQSHEQQQLQKE